MRIEAVSKKIEDHLILDEVSFALERGKITAFIGPNGAGKSTLLSIISRLLKKDSGAVYLRDRKLEEWKPNDLAKELTILKQQNVFQVRMTVEELLSFGRFPYSKGRLKEEDHQKIEQVLAYLNLKEFQHRYLDTLSGGQLQRAAIAMTLVQDTDYILLDEPLNNLDLKQSMLMMQAIRSMADDLKKTILLVIHDVNFAAAYADNIVAMKKGKVVAQGPTRDVFQTEVLQEVFDLPIEVTEVNGRPTCLYYMN